MLILKNNGEDIFILKSFFIYMQSIAQILCKNTLF